MSEIYQNFPLYLQIILNNCPRKTADEWIYMQAYFFIHHKWKFGSWVLKILSAHSRHFMTGVKSMCRQIFSELMNESSIYESINRSSICRFLNILPAHTEYFHTVVESMCRRLFSKLVNGGRLYGFMNGIYIQKFSKTLPVHPKHNCEY